MRVIRPPLTSISSPQPNRDRRLWRAIAPLVSQRRRFLFEGCPGIPGQLWYADRALIYDTVLELRPRACYEVGTYNGGGSTFFIGSALARNGAGILHSIEIDPGLHGAASDSLAAYAPEITPHLALHLGDYRDVLPPLLDVHGVDFFMLDGAEDAEQTLEQLHFFEQWAKPGTRLIAHDWNTDKCAGLRAEIQSAGSRWVIEREIGQPRSVGMVRAKLAG